MPPSDDRMAQLFEDIGEMKAGIKHLVKRDAEIVESDKVFDGRLKVVETHVRRINFVFTAIAYPFRWCARRFA